MPRFSDIFVYSSVKGDLVNGTVFSNCYLIKKVDGLTYGSKIDEIQFDIHGMVLFFRIGVDIKGPYMLTVSDPYLR